MFVTIGRVFRFAFQNFARNAWLSAATVSVLVLTLVSVNLLVTLNVLGKIALSAVESRIDVSVHFKPEVEESRVQTVKTALLTMPEVAEVAYVTPAQALTDFSKDYAKDEDVVRSLGEVGQNPFGASLVVRARSLDGYPKVLSTLDDPAFAGLIDGKDFDDRQVVIDRVKGIAANLQYFLLGVSGVFGLITLLIVWNTIRVSVYTRREEIGVMRLVGGGDGFIRWPFYVEAVFWSMLAFALAFGAFLPALSFAQPYLAKFFGTGSVDVIGFYRANILTIVVAEFSGVAVMALLTTKMATSRYLKV
jgi:cell division transport system permease protein